MSYTVTNSHPRIWLTAQRLADLQNEANSGNVKYTTLKNYVDSHLNNSFPPSIYDFALLYAITGNTVYADRAIALVSGQLTAGNGDWEDSGLNARDWLPTSAICYDWCNDRIVALGLKTFFVSGMTQWADYFWPETYGTSNPPGPPVDFHGNAFFAQTYPLSNYYSNYTNTWMIGLALFYDTPKASGYVNNAINRWNGTILPQLQSADFTYSASGGYLLEGTNYGLGRTTPVYFYNLAAHYTATGDNLFTSGGTTWCKDAVTDTLYLTCPNNSQLYSGGDQSASAGAGLQDAHRGLMLMAQSYLDSTTAGYARKYSDTVGACSDANDLWKEFLWYNYAVPVVDYTATLSGAYYSPGAGFVTSRNDWTTDGTVVSMICGKATGNSADPGSHSDDAANGLVIWRQGWIVGQAKVSSHSGIHKEGSYNNSVTIGGHEQYSFNNTNNGPFIKHFQNATDYCYFSGDATNAYQKSGQTTYLNGFRRDVIHLKPNFVVVCDRLDAPDSSLTKKTHWNGTTLTVPATGANTFAISGFANLYKVFGTVHLPSSPTITPTLVSLGGSTDDQPSSYRIDVAAPTGNGVDYFLQTMETAPSSQGAASTVTNLSTNATGVQGIQIGNQVVVFEMRPGPANSFNFNITGTGSKTFYVPTDHTNTGYTWNITPTSGTAASTGAVTSDSAGILKWSVSTTGNVTVALTPNAAPPPFSVYQPAGTIVSQAAANSTVTLSGDHFSTSSGSVTVGSSGMTLSSWTDTAIVGTLPTQASYPSTNDITVSWTSTANQTGMASFASANSQFMKVANSGLLSGKPMSWNYWVRFRTLSATQSFFSKWGTSFEWLFQYDHTANRIQLAVSKDGSAVSFAVANTFGAPTTGVWYNVVGLCDGTGFITIAVNNGSGDGVNAGGSQVGTNPMDLGRHEPSTEYFDGDLRSVGVWQKVLNATEITALYNNGTPLQYSSLSGAVSGGTLLTSLSAWYNLNDAGGSGASWLDSSGNGLNMIAGTGSQAPTSGTTASTTGHTDVYSSFVTTSPGSTGSLTIYNIQQNSVVVTSARALSTVSISGTLFGATSGTVFFDVNSATVTAWTDNLITCLVPTQTSYPDTLTVTVNGSNGQTSSQGNFTVNAPAPTITDIEQPLHTPVTSATHGSTVDIVGTHFGSTSGSVTFNGVSATINSWSDTDINLVVPGQNSYPNAGTVVVTLADSQTVSTTFTTTGQASLPPVGVGGLSALNMLLRRKIRLS